METLHSNIKCIEIIDNEIENTIGKIRCSFDRSYYVSSFLKLECFKMDKYDKLLFLDGDTLIISSLKDLFEKNIPLGFCRDYNLLYNIEDKPIDHYFNGGMFYFGNKKYRNNIFFESLLQYANEAELFSVKNVYGTESVTFRYTEQDLLVQYIYENKLNDVYLLDSCYNALYAEGRFYPDLKNNLKIIHYLAKPDNIYTRNKTLIDLWNNYTNVEIENKKVICLLTSWKKRITFVPKACELLLKQTVKPNEIWLTLSSDEFKNKENDLPDDLLDLINNNNNNKVNLYWTDKNTKVIKKIFPIINKFNDDDIIINCDDDINYPIDILESRLSDFKKHGCIHPITAQYNSLRHGINTWAAIGIFSKKMLNGLEHILNDEVISTYEDDGIVSYLFALNGYSPKLCSKYNCLVYDFITLAYGSGASGLYDYRVTNKVLDKRVNELYGISFDDIIYSKTKYEYISEFGRGIQHFFHETEMSIDGIKESYKIQKTREIKPKNIKISKTIIQSKKEQTKTIQPSKTNPLKNTNTKTFRRIVK